MDEQKLGLWRDRIKEEIERWRKDNNYIPVLPPCPMDADLVREQRMIAIEERLTRLEQVSDQNAAVFSDSLKFAELCIQALQRGFDDMLIGAVKTIEIGPEDVLVSGIDANGSPVQETITAPARRAVDFRAYLQEAITAADAAKADVAINLGSASGKVARAGDQIAFEFGG